MAFWLCRLDSQANLTTNGPDPTACDVRGWLLEADLTPDELRQPTNWKLYQHCGAGLPFALDCRLLVPFTPTQEQRAATLLAPWLVSEGSLRLQGRPVLLLRGAQQFSHRRFGPRGLRLALNSALRRLGCTQPLLLLCWQNDPIQSADAVVDCIPAVEELHVTHEQEINQQNLRLETLLAASHHVFPYTNYRLLRPDLSSFTNEDLVEHFAAYGINEGVNLQFSDVENELQQLRAHQAEQTARLEILNEKTRHTSQQLDLLKDLLARLMVNP
jgi:hypothetical protein